MSRHENSPDFLQPHLWTSGAWRLLQRAAQAASTTSSDEILPIHLLWALLVDEGRAGEMLATSGLSTSSFDPVHPLLAQLNPDDVYQTPPHEAWSALSQSIAREARHIAFHESQATEAGTDHLLTALSTADSDASYLLVRLLHRGGIATPASRRRPVPPDPEAVPETIDVDLRLELRERTVEGRVELYRILDAAANRVREALRVLEDYTRFGLNDRSLTSLLKQLRHEIAESMSRIPSQELLASRETQLDVGTTLETAREYHRLDSWDVLIAAFKRGQEALRTLEEYGKVVSGDLGRRFEQVRYRLYTLEKAVITTTSAQARLANQYLYLLLSDDACPSGWVVVLRAALEAGIRMFQVREKTMPDRALVEHCRLLRKWTREHQAVLIVNDRPDIAVACDADGVHVGQDEMSVADVRRIVGPQRLIGVSTHSLSQARQAVLDGADYLGVGPTFPSTTKSFAQFPGLELIREVSQALTLPWFAIGGIDDTNIAAAIEAGARRVAVTRGVSASSQPVESASSMLTALRNAATTDAGGIDQS